ncbi:glycosyltransferase [Metabacillus schmidteae]|uniref:glycosyltransferase n=1 Tax=Metabacillus schmidteae TaxID=2730405 RepID=UPI0015886AEE|nr:glycosyltransferase [Metabacillus schmidteae]
MISIIACTIRDSMMENIFNNFNRQILEEKELLIILNKDNMNKNKWEEMANKHQNVFVYQLPQKKTLGECLNFGIEKANFNIIAKLDDDDYYSEYYLSEAMSVFNTTDVQLVGKGMAFMFFEKQKLLTIRKLGSENKLGKSSIKGGTIIFRKEIYPSIKFPSRKGSGTDSVFIKRCKKNNIKTFTTSRYNYVYIRRVNPKNHTYKRSNNDLIQKSIIIGKVKNYVPIITRAIFSSK